MKIPICFQSAWEARRLGIKQTSLGLGISRILIGFHGIWARATRRLGRLDLAPGRWKWASQPKDDKGDAPAAQARTGLDGPARMGRHRSWVERHDTRKGSEVERSEGYQASSPSWMHPARARCLAVCCSRVLSSDCVSRRDRAVESPAGCVLDSRTNVPPLLATDRPRSSVDLAGRRLFCRPPWPDL